MSNQMLFLRWPICLFGLLANFFQPANAADKVWLGTSSGNWNEASNWVGGIAPVNGDSVILTSSGTAPSLQNIPNLVIDWLKFAEFTEGGNPETVSTAPPANDFTLSGDTFTLNSGFDFPNGYATSLQYTISNNIILGATIAPKVEKPFSLTISGVISDGGNGYALSTIDATDGNLILSGINTFSGVLDAGGLDLGIYEDRNLGAVPATYTANIFKQGNGSNSSYLRVLNSPSVAYAERVIHQNRGMNLKGQLIAEDKVKLIFAGNVNSIGKVLGGEVIFEGESDDTSQARVDSSTTQIMVHLKKMNSLGLGEIYTSSKAWLNLNGLSLPNDMILARYNSVDGGVINLNTQSTSTLSGNTGIGYVYSNTTVGGPGDIILSGNIYDATGASQNSGFRWSGTGTLTLSGNTSYIQDNHLTDGRVILDHRVENDSKLTSGYATSIKNCELIMIGNDSASSSENIMGGTGNDQFFEAGFNKISVYSGLNQDATLTINAYERNRSQLGCDFTTINNGTGVARIVITSPLSNFNNGTISAGYTFSGNTWASIDAGSNIMGLSEASYGSSLTADTHVSLAAGITTMASGVDAIDSLRFNAPGGSNLILQSGSLYIGPTSAEAAADGRPGGGILVTPEVGANDVFISDGGGDLKARSDNSGLFIHQNNTSGNLTISAKIANFGNYALVKTGPGELVLTNVNNSFYALHVHGGTLTFNSVSDTYSTLGRNGLFYTNSANLRYIGTGHSTNRSIVYLGNLCLDASGTGPFQLTSTTGITLFSSEVKFPTITLTGTGDGRIDGPVELSNGSLIKTGSGNWTLASGSNDISGTTHIKAGGLSVAQLSGNCIVEPGATLMGMGNITKGLKLGGSLNVELRSDTDFDGFTAGGCVVLGGNLNISLASGYDGRHVYPIIRGADQISGSFSSITPGYHLYIDEHEVVVLPDLDPPAAMFWLK